MTTTTVNKTRKAVMFRGPDYGALVVSLMAEGVQVVNHNIHREDVAACVAVLSRYGRASRVNEDTTLWRLGYDTHPATVMATVVSEMRLRGYEDDALAERAISRLSFEKTERPDLPAGGKVLVHEAVERGIRQQLAVVVAALRESGKASVPSLRFFQRPNAQSLMGKRPPFALARIFISEGDIAQVRKVVLEALKPWREHLVKVAVHEADQGLAVEVGLRLPASLCESFMDSAVPVFEHQDITGCREVVFRLEEPLTEEERNDIAELGRACTGLLQLQQEGTTLTTLIPSGFIGHYSADRTLSERMSWLHLLLQPWGADLQTVSGLKEVVIPEPEPKKVLLRDRLSEARDEMAAVEVIDTLNDKYVQQIRGNARDFHKMLKRYKAPRYTVQLLNQHDDIMADNLGMGGSIRTFRKWLKVAPTGELAAPPPHMRGFESVQPITEAERATLEKRIYSKIPSGSKAKRNGKLVIMLTGDVAERMGVEEYSAMTLQDIPEDTLMKLGLLLKVKGVSEGFEKPEYADDFAAGFEAGRAAYERDPMVSAADAKREYRKVSRRHGSWWVDGYTAALDIARGAYNTSVARVAKAMGLSEARGDIVDLLQQWDVVNRDYVKAMGEVFKWQRRYDPRAHGEWPEYDAAREEEARLKAEREKLTVKLARLYKRGERPPTDMMGMGSMDYTFRSQSGSEMARSLRNDMNAMRRGEPIGEADDGPGMLGRTLVKAAGTFKPATPAGLDGSDEEEKKDADVDTADKAEEPIDEARVKADFEIKLRSGQSQIVTGGYVVNNVWGVEPGWYLHHIPTGAGVGEFSAMKNALKAADELVATGFDWMGLKNVSRVPSDIGNQAAEILRRLGGKAKPKKGTRKAGKVASMAEFAKLSWRTIKTGISVTLEKEVENYVWAKRVSRDPNLGHGARAQFMPSRRGMPSYSDTKKKVDAARKVLKDTYTDHYDNIMDPKPETAGLSPGDSLAALEKAMKAVKSLTIKHGYGKTKVKVKLHTFRWGTARGRETILFDVSWEGTG